MSTIFVARRKARVVVLGALGGVGRGIVRAIFERSAPEIEPLVITSRDAARLAAYHASMDNTPNLVPIAGSVATSAEADRLRARILELGAIDIVIASLGGWWSGPALTGIDDATWHGAIDALLTPHVVCARTFLPALEHDGAKYLLIGGGAALRPVPGSSLVSIAGAAQAMLTRTLVAERADSVRPLIHELLIDGPLDTEAPHHGPRTSGEITAIEVGRAVAAWCLGSPDGAPHFDWPASRLSTEGPITTMR